MGSPAHGGAQQREPEPAGIGILPPELILEIASSGLVLEDFSACVQVSRQWYATWSQPAVAAALCRRFFPTLPKPHTFAAFQSKSRKFFRRRHGRYTAVVDLAWADLEAGLPSYFEPVSNTYPDGSRPEQVEQCDIMAYGNGNLVWSNDQRLIFIDNLYTRKRKVLRGDNWNIWTCRTEPHACAVSESLLATEVEPAVRQGGQGHIIFIYHLATNMGVKHMLEESQEYYLGDWLSIRSWGELVYITTGPSSVHVLRHDGARLSLVHVINPHASLAPEWHGFARRVREDGNPMLDQERTNFLPNPHDGDGVFIVLAGTIPGFEPDGDYFLVREFSGTTHVSTYACDVWGTVRRVMEDVFGKDSEFVQQELAAAQKTARGDGSRGGTCYEWGLEQDEWPGAYGSDEGIYEVFRFVFKALDATDSDTFDWQFHYQVSVTFSTFTRRFIVQRAFIDDGEDMQGDNVDEWIPRASMVRNQQLLRVYYDSYDYTDAIPVITARDVTVTPGEERTHSMIGKRDDLYPLRHENRSWMDRCDPDIHMRLFHDEDFTILWDYDGGDCVVFDFREP